MTAKATATPDPRTVQVSRYTLQQPWPFKVDRGTVRCDPGPKDTIVLTFRADDGTTYPLNDFNHQDAQIKRIWVTGVSLEPILRIGERICARRQAS